MANYLIRLNSSSQIGEKENLKPYKNQLQMKYEVSLVVHVRLCLAFKLSFEHYD